jgi:hypothetical protein
MKETRMQPKRTRPRSWSPTYVSNGDRERRRRSGAFHFPVPKPFRSWSAWVHTRGRHVVFRDCRAESFQEGVMIDSANMGHLRITLHDR